MRTVRLIGYWRSNDEPFWPDPFDFIDDDWDDQERQLVASYLDAAANTPWSYMGMSWCRICRSDPAYRRPEDRGEEREVCVNGLVLRGFAVGPAESNGAGEFSDGVYVWPEGLSHYVREHSVRLPEMVVRHIRGASRGTPMNVESMTMDDIDQQYWKSVQPD